MIQEARQSSGHSCKGPMQPMGNTRVHVIRMGQSLTTPQQWGRLQSSPSSQVLNPIPNPYPLPPMILVPRITSPVPPTIITNGKRGNMNRRSRWNLVNVNELCPSGRNWRRRHPLPTMANKPWETLPNPCSSLFPHIHTYTLHDAQFGSSCIIPRFPLWLASPLGSLFSLKA